MSGYPSRSDLSRIKHRSLVDLGYRSPGRRTTVATVVSVSLVCLVAVGSVLGVVAWRLVTGRQASEGRTENNGEEDGASNQTTWSAPTGKPFNMYTDRTTRCLQHQSNYTGSCLQRAMECSHSSQVLVVAECFNNN